MGSVLPGLVGQACIRKAVDHESGTASNSIVSWSLLQALPQLP